MEQMSLFDTLRRPAVRLNVDPDGGVIRGDAEVTYRLEHPRMAWDRARIELHPHENGLWMWATDWNCDSGGGGYKVGAKWGKFAETREDALFYAASELEAKLKDKTTPDARLILKWVETLKGSSEALL